MGNLPHIVIFNPDQWRGDVLGHMGNPGAVTPVLDRLAAEEAVSFRNAFCQNPVCTPSRCSFMTGWYPHVRGHRSMHHMLQPDEPMLLKRLKEAGYYVWWGGKNDVVPAQHGFEAYCSFKNPDPDPQQRPMLRNLHAYDDWRGGPGGADFYSFYYGRIEKPAGFPEQEPFVYDGDWHQVLSAIHFIRDHPPHQPLCIYLPLTSPHPPYAVEDPWYSQIDRAALPPRIPAPVDWGSKPSILSGIYARQGLTSWNESRWDELRATYYGMCARTDAQLGMLIGALQEAGLYEHTALFFFADHGDFTGDYGLVEKTQNTFEDCLTRVPFLIKPPRGVPLQPRLSQALVELVDFPATVEALTGLVPRHTHFGRSLLPVLAGERDHHRQAVFCEGGRLHGEGPAAQEPISGEHPSRGLYWPRISLQHSPGPEHTKAVMCRTHTHKYVRRLYEEDELYDLDADPGELRNRIGDPSLAPVLEEMRQRLLDFFLETGDVVPENLDQR